MTNQHYAAALAWCFAQTEDFCIADLLAHLGASDDSTRRTVHNWLKRLAEWGHLEVRVSNEGNVYRRSNVHRCLAAQSSDRLQVQAAIAKARPPVPAEVKLPSSGNDGFFEPMEARWQRMLKRFREQVTKRSGVDYFRLAWHPWSPAKRPRGIPDGYIEAQPLLLAAPDSFVNAIGLDSHHELDVLLDYSELPRRDLFDLAMCHFVWLQCQRCRKPKPRTSFDPFGVTRQGDGPFCDQGNLWHCKDCAGEGVDTSMWQKHGELARQIRSALLNRDAVALGEIRVHFSAQCSTVGDRR